MSEQYQRGDDYDPALEAIADAIVWDDVPKSRKLPEMLYDFDIIDCYTGTTRGSDTSEPTYKIVVVFSVTAPQEFAGRTQDENFLIGTDRDPMAVDKSTWLSEAHMSFGCELLNRLRLFVGAKTWRDLPGHSLSAFVRQNGNYANIVTSQFYSKGELAPGTPTAPSRGRRTRSAQAPAVAIPTSAKCPICLADIEATDIVDHVQNCRA